MRYFDLFVLIVFTRLRAAQAQPECPGLPPGATPAPGTTSECCVYYIPSPLDLLLGDLCGLLCNVASITEGDLLSLNMGLHGLCDNLIVGCAYCVLGAFKSPALSTATLNLSASPSLRSGTSYHTGSLGFPINTSNPSLTQSSSGSSSEPSRFHSASKPGAKSSAGPSFRNTPTVPGSTYPTGPTSPWLGGDYSGDHNDNQYGNQNVNYNDNHDGNRNGNYNNNHNGNQNDNQNINYNNNHNGNYNNNQNDNYNYNGDDNSNTNSYNSNSNVNENCNYNANSNTNHSSNNNITGNSNTNNNITGNSNANTNITGNSNATSNYNNHHDTNDNNTRGINGNGVLGPTPTIKSPSGKGVYPAATGHTQAGGSPNGSSGISSAPPGVLAGNAIEASSASGILELCTWSAVLMHGLLGAFLLL